MIRRRIAPLLAPLFLLLLLLAASPGDARGDSPLRLAVAPFYAPEKMWALYSPFVDHLRERTGEPWALAVPPDHKALAEAVCGGGAEAVILGPAAAAMVMERCRLRPVAVALGPTGKPWYTAVVATADPSVRSLGDLRGKRFGYFEGSTAAHLVPLRMLADARVDPADLTLVPLSGQDRIVGALLQQDISAAGIKETTFRRFASKELRRVAESSPLPNFAVYASPSLPRPSERKLVAALLASHPASRGGGGSPSRPWDDEVRHGFVLPPKGFLDRVLALGKEGAPAAR